MLKWRKTYGDGDYTDDLVLWIDGKATNHVISQNSGYYVCYIDDVNSYITNSVRDAKLFILSSLGY